MNTFTIEIEDKQKIKYKLNKGDMTASIIDAEHTEGSILIPRFIEYADQKYKIISIEKEAFKFFSADSLTFSKDSEIKIFKKEAFFTGEFNKLEIPSSLETIESGCFFCINYIKDIEISPKNKNFSYINNKFLVGKSDPNQDEFDVIHLCNRNKDDKEEEIIPAFIKIIGENSFSSHNCAERIKRLIIPENSKLETIEKKGLPIILQKLFIPKNLKSISKDSMYRLKELEEIVISPENRTFSLINNECLIKKDEKTKKCELVFTFYHVKKLTIPQNFISINDNSIYSKKFKFLTFEKNSICERIGEISTPNLEYLYIPKNLKYIGYYAFIDSKKLNIIEISPECKSFKLIDNKCLLRKSEGSDTFDELVFCSRDIVKLRVPKSVKKIAKYALQYCCKLVSLTFEENSSLEIIDECSFQDCIQLKQIVIPGSLSVGCSALSCSYNIKYIQFTGERIYIDNYYGSNFISDSLEIISFPNAKAIFYRDNFPKNAIIEVRKDAQLSGKILNFDKNRIKYKDPGQFLEIIEEMDEHEKLIKMKDDLLSKISEQKQQIKQQESLNLKQKEKLKGKQKDLREISDNLKKGNQIKTPDFHEIQFLTSSDLQKLKHISVIGSGSAGKVIKVGKLETYAQKQMNVDEGFDEERFQNFTQEYKLLNMLKHPNIIKVYGIFNGDKETPPCILMEFCDSNLENAILQKQLSTSDIAIIIYQIAEGIRFIHFKKVIHRDIKPRNILINKDKIVKICDFGISKYLFGDETSLTGGPGTQKFMAPEMINEEKNYTEKIDVYSFGVVIFYIITGKMPNISIGKIASGNKAEIPKDVNDFARSLINDCWNFDPKSRPSFAEICQRLKENNYEVVNLNKYEKIEVSNFVLKFKATIPPYDEDEQTFLGELIAPKKRSRKYHPKIYKVPE